MCFGLRVLRARRRPTDHGWGCPLLPDRGPRALWRRVRGTWRPIFAERAARNCWREAGGRSVCRIPARPKRDTKGLESHTFALDRGWYFDSNVKGKRCPWHKRPKLYRMLWTCG